jgi:hypothetical protein
MWGLKMAAYVAVLLGLCFVISRRSKERDAWRVKWQEATAAALDAHHELIELQDSIRVWKAQGEAQRIQLAAAVNDAAEISARFDVVTAKIMATPVPFNAEGALGWMADVAQTLRDEAGR